MLNDGASLGDIIAAVLISMPLSLRLTSATHTGTISYTELFDTRQVTVSQRDSRIRSKRHYHSPYLGVCTVLSLYSAQTLGQGSLQYGQILDRHTETTIHMLNMYQHSSMAHASQFLFESGQRSQLIEA